MLSTFRLMVMRVSIPRSEFWSFGRELRTVVQTTWLYRFQFLGRNSGRSDSISRIRPCTIPGGFNSSVGILVVRTSSAYNDNHASLLVSIPRSEFWSFGRRKIKVISEVSHKFQFLGRNSGRSDSMSGVVTMSLPPVSIPRSEFWSFGLYSRNGYPQSWTTFQFLGRNSGRSDVKTVQPGGNVIPLFQFLGRNSGRSDLSRRVRNRRGCYVSIPRSEFWSFGRGVA